MYGDEATIDVCVAISKDTIKKYHNNEITLTKALATLEHWEIDYKYCEMTSTIELGDY
jgi:hypothetical protein